MEEHTLMLVYIHGGLYNPKVTPDAFVYDMPLNSFYDNNSEVESNIFYVCLPYGAAVVDQTFT